MKIKQFEKVKPLFDAYFTRYMFLLYEGGVREKNITKSFIVSSKKFDKWNVC